MAKQAARLRKPAAEGCEVPRPAKAAAEVLKLWGLPKTCHIAVSKPNKNSLWGLGRYHGQASGTPSKAAAEGCEVLTPAKAAAEVLRLWGLQNVPHSSFEAQEKQLAGPREVPWPSKWDAFESCCGSFEAFGACPKRAT